MKRTARRAVSLALALSTCSSLLLANPSTQLLSRTVLTASAEDTDPVDESFGIDKTYLKTDETLRLKNADGMTVKYFIGTSASDPAKTEIADVPASGLVLTSAYYEKWIIVEATDADDQVSTDAVYFSKLPVVYLNTKKGETPVQKDDKVKGTMYFQNNDETETAFYDGDMTLSGRGNTTWGWDKKPYKLKLDTSTDFYGYGKSKKWVLLANYLDESLLRNTTASRLAEELGLVSMQTEWVDLVINGEYAGNYQLCEQVGIEKGRVNIFDWEKECSNAYEAVAAALTADMSKEDAKAFKNQLEPLMTENMSWIETDKIEFTYMREGSELDGTAFSFNVSDYYEYNTDFTGGYLYESSEEFDETSEFLTKRKMKVMMKSPEYMLTNETMTQTAMKIIQEFEDAICSPNGYNPTTGKHYTELADLDSMVSYWLLMEILGNNDARYKSRYIYKPQDKDGVKSKLVFGPPWDFDTGLGSSLVTEPWGLTENSEDWATGWKVSNYQDPFNLPEELPEGVNATMEDKPDDAFGQNFYRELLDDPLFIASATEKYWQIRPYLENLIKENGKLDEYSAYLKESGEADSALWNRKEGEYNAEWNSYARGYEEDTAVFKEYLRKRIEWLDAQFDTDAALLATREDQPSAAPYVRSDDMKLTVLGADENPDKSHGGADYIAAAGTGVWISFNVTDDYRYEDKLSIYVNGIEVDAACAKDGNTFVFAISGNELYGQDGKKNVISVIWDSYNDDTDDYCTKCKNFVTVTEYAAPQESIFDAETGTLTLHGRVLNTVSAFPPRTRKVVGGGILLPKGVTKTDVKKIVVAADTVLPENSDNLFKGLYYMTEIHFEDCSTAHVTNMDSLFCDCQNLKVIDFGSKFCTSNVKNFTNMFYNCSSLSTLDLSCFDTSAVTTMNSMFSECENLTSLDLSSFTTAKLKNTQCMFGGCSNLERITVSDGWKLADGNNDDMQSGYMFDKCKKLKGGNGTAFDQTHIDGAYARIDGKDGTPGYLTASLLNNVSVTLKDDLALNFIIDGVNAENAAEYSVKLTGLCDEDGKTITPAEKDFGGVKAYCVSANISANHMDSAITARAYHNGEEVCARSFSINRYLAAVAANDSITNPNLKNLVETVSLYGEVSDAYFTTGDVSGISGLPSYTKEDLAGAEQVWTDGVKMSLVLNSKMAARVYIPDAKAGETADYEGAALKAVSNNRGVYFEIKNIVPTELMANLTFTYKDKDYSFKPLTWSYRALSDEESSAKDIAMANILYEYYKAAKAYMSTL